MNYWLIDWLIDWLYQGLTPLMMACMFGRSMIAAYLLGKGAAPHLTGNNNKHLRFFLS